MAEAWVSVEDVAKHLNVAKHSVYRWIENRDLLAHKIGRLRKLKLTEADAWVRSFAKKEIRSKLHANGTRNNPVECG